MSLFDVSLGTANALYAWGWRLSLGGAVITAAGVALLMWGTHGRDLDIEQQVGGLQGAVTAAQRQAQASADDAAATKRALQDEKAARAALEAQQAQLVAHQADRHLSDEQKNALVKAIAPFAGQKVLIASILGQPEGKSYADDWVSVFDQANWDHNGDAGISWNQWDKDPVGVEITLNPDDAQAQRLTLGIAALIQTARSLGLIDPATIFVSADVPPGTIQVRVGTKP